MNKKTAIIILFSHACLYAQDIEMQKVATKDDTQITIHGFNGDDVHSNFFNMPGELQCEVLKIISAHESSTPGQLTNKPYLTIKNEDNNILYAYNHVKQLLAVANPKNAIYLIDLLQTNKRPKKLKMTIPNDFIFDASGEELLFCYKDMGLFSIVRSYNLETKKERVLTAQIENIHKIAISNDNKQLAVALENRIDVINLDTKDIFRSFEINRPITYLKFNASGDRLVKIDTQKVCRLYNVETGFTSASFADITPEHPKLKEHFSPAHDLMVPESLKGRTGKIDITINPDYLKKSFENLKEYQKSLIAFLFGAERSLQERHKERQEKEGESYTGKYQTPMPIDFDLFKKYNPQFKTWDFHGTLSKFDPILKWHLVKRFNIVRK